MLLDLFSHGLEPPSMSSSLMDTSATPAQKKEIKEMRARKKRRQKASKSFISCQAVAPVYLYLRPGRGEEDPLESRAVLFFYPMRHAAMRDETVLCCGPVCCNWCLAICPPRRSLGTRTRTIHGIFGGRIASLETRTPLGVGRGRVTISRKRVISILIGRFLIMCGTVVGRSKRK